MKKITLLSFLLLGITLTNAQETQKSHRHFGKVISSENLTPTGHIRCLSTEYEEFLQEQNPKRLSNDQFENWIAPLIENYKQEQMVSSQSGGIIRIPVVVHVIHNGDAYGVNENITDEQVQSQITVMTQDFRRMAGTPGYNSSSVGADTTIEFVLAKVDPNGNPTNGINRVNLCEDSWSTTDINTIVKPNTIWNPTQYMNMWSVNFTDSTLLGYAQFPDASGLGGLNTIGGAANTDGVVAGYGFFGSSDLATGNFSAPYDKGRTMTHEVGHYLGLRHIWGDTTCGTDYCNDTPVHRTSNGGCPTHPKPNTCGTSDEMFENYMDYTDDACMNIFTQDQKTRILTVMNNSPRRASLKTSTKDLAITLFANDAEVIIENSCNIDASCTNLNPSIPLKVISLYNRGTSNLTSAAISYNMNGGTNYVYNFVGNLAPNKFAYISLPYTDVNGTLNTTVTTANGVADQRASNNVSSKTFNFTPGTIPNYNYSNYTFNLIGDPFGDETSWEIRNSSNAIVYSGGPYTFTGAAGTQVLESGMTWTLAPDCYIFTIFDSYGDGLAGSSSGGVSNNDQGSWTITTNGGAITVGSGGDDFGDSESITFTNTSLSATNFGLDAISLYPNPTKDVLNISVPSELGNKTSYEVINYLGQSVVKSNSSNSNFTVNTSNFASGVYFIKLQTENGAKTLKFIKE